MNVLDGIVAATRADVAARKAENPFAAPAVSTRAPGAFRQALSGPGLAVIAEHKRRSPSAGTIRAGASVAEIVGAYEHGGAAALSILTEEHSFAGSLTDLSDARAATDLPLLRKDFIVDVHQLDEAVAAGADAVLLVVAALTGDELDELHGGARERGLDVLVEVHDAEQLDRALAVGPHIIGVNNRNLRDFSVDVNRTLELAPQIPPGIVVVSESGLGDMDRLRELQAAGVHAALIGEALMRAPDPAAALQAITAGLVRTNL